MALELILRQTPDPDGFGSALRLKGDWIFVGILPKHRESGETTRVQKNQMRPLLAVCKMALHYKAEVSPHNPSGPISTAASLHSAAIHPHVTSLEYPFDKTDCRKSYEQNTENGWMHITDQPGWGIEMSGFF